MAIRLSGTPQQQKAPFSAFDTSSNFQSGLVDVGRAIRQVGAGQRRVEDEIERKEKAGQNLLALNIEGQYGSALQSKYDEVEEAIRVGAPKDKMDLLQKEFDAFNPRGTNFDLHSYAPQNRRIDLTNEEYTTKTNLNIAKEFDRLSRTIRSKRTNADAYQSSVEFVKEEENLVMNFVNDNPAGVSHEDLVSKIDELIEGKRGERYEAVLQTTSVGEPRAAFQFGRKSNILNLMYNQVENEAPLSANELDARWVGIREILDNPKYKNLGITADDEELLEKAYNTKRTAGKDLGFQKQQVTQLLTQSFNEMSLLMDADSIKPENINRIETMLATASGFDKSAFNDTQLAKLNSMAQLAGMFIPAPTSEPVSQEDYFNEVQEAPAYQLLEYMFMVPEDREMTLATAFKNVYGKDFTKFALAPTEQRLLSDWVSKNIKALKQLGDSPKNIERLSPFHAEMVERAEQGDKSAYNQIDKEYRRVVGSNPDLKGKVSAAFYVTQAEFPTGKIGSDIAAVEAIATNVNANGAINVIINANTQIDRGDLTDLELLRYQGERLYAGIIHRTGNVEEAQKAASTLVGYYTSGGEANKQADDILEIITQEDNKFARDEPGRIISLFSLISAYENSTDAPDLAPFYKRMLRGAVKLQLGNLVDKDPEEQHEIIRDALFERKDVFPIVALTESGSSVEIPMDLNKYIDESKDRTGFFGRVWYPYTKLIGEQESIKVVQSVYSGAAVAYLVDNYPSINVEKRLRDIESEITGLERAENPYRAFSYAPIGYVDRSEGPKQQDTNRALLKKLFTIQVDGKPAAKLVAEIHKDQMGVARQVAVLKLINRDGKYEAIARDVNDQRPVTAPIAELTAVVDKAMPELFGIEPDTLSYLGEFMPVPFTEKGNMYYRQLVKMEDFLLYKKGLETYSDMYGEVTEEN